MLCGGPELRLRGRLLRALLRLRGRLLRPEVLQAEMPHPLLQAALQEALPQGPARFALQLSQELL